MLNTLTRRNQLKNMEEAQYDLIVIGGGITGAGIALDAAKRGMKIALVEMQDFAEGTSSRSTKLVHGGLRYLKQFQVGVVRETGRERAIVYENGPHVTTPEWMLLPFHKGGNFGKTMTSVGLRMYDTLAQVKKNERRKMLSVNDVKEKEPLVKQNGLKGGGYYVEYKTDDARMTIEVMKKASEFGADAINYIKAENFTYEKGKVSGIEARDMLEDKKYYIKGRRVVNATGPWVDDTRKNDPASNKIDKTLVLTKGVHVVFDQQDFPLRQAIYFDTKDDGRMMFAIPREGKTYVGTTDTFFVDDKAEPVPSKDDKQYLLKNINYMFPGLDLDEHHIESSWAGIRPLVQEKGKGPSELSRKDEIWVADSNLITIAGGKLTGYRHMAEEIVDLVAKHLEKDYKLKFKDCETKHQAISGGDVGGSKAFENFVTKMADLAESYGLNANDGGDIALKYGSNAEELFKLVLAVGSKNDYSLSPLQQAQVLYSIQYEMVAKPVDYFIRRTGDLYFNVKEVYDTKDGVIQYMQDLLGWDEATKEVNTLQLERALSEATVNG